MVIQRLKKDPDVREAAYGCRIVFQIVYMQA